MILQELVARYDREAARGRVVPYGSSMESVAFVLVLDKSGRVIDVQDLRDGKKTPRIPLPTPPKSTGNIAPRYLYGNSSYVIGVMTEAQVKKLPSKEEGLKTPELAGSNTKKVEKRCAAEHIEWNAYHREALASSDDTGLQAVLRFIETWTPKQIKGLRYADELTSGTIALRLDGDTNESGAPRLICDRPAAREIWEHLSAPTDAFEGVCLVTGKAGPIARLHPSIKGVSGAQSSGASLVSYNCAAVEHFGPDSQGLNGPISVAAAHAYTTALKAMLADQKHRVRIGDATAVLWVETDGEAAPAEELLTALFSGGGVKVTEESEAAHLRETLVQIAAGRPLAEADLGLDPGTRYHALALGPAAGRLVIRFYLSGTLGDLARRVGEHWQDMRLEPLAWRTPPPVQWLALHTVPARRRKGGGYDRDADAINPNLPGDMLRSIHTGQRYPAGLLQTLVQRLATDGDISGLRISMIRACLSRDYRLGFSAIGAPMALDPDNPTPAYQLGRLFAALENAYRLANPESERSLADGNYRLASTQPGAAMPRLLATAQHHLSAIRRADKGGLAHVIGKDIEDITARLGTAFPRALNTLGQGHFALGYYHQRGHRRQMKTEARTESLEV